MDDGAKSAELIFRLSLAAKEMLLKLILKTLKAYIDHMEWLKQHNIKPSWKARIDRAQINVVKITTSLVEKQVEISREKVIGKERELDKFKLDKQYELEEKYNVEVNKAQKALEIELGKENKDSDKITEKQLLLDEALENKRKFEYETNKEILKKNHELDNYKSELSKCENDLKVCNAKLNALYSQQNIESGRLKREYGSIADKYSEQDKAEDLSQGIIDIMNQSKNAENNPEIKNIEAGRENNEKEDIISQIDDKISKEKIGKDIEEIEKTCQNIDSAIDQSIEHNYESNEYYDNLENDIDKLSKLYEETEKNLDSLELNNKDVDRVEKMLSKDPEALKAYEEKKEKGDFKIENVPNDKNLEIGGR